MKPELNWTSKVGLQLGCTKIVGLCVATFFFSHILTKQRCNLSNFLCWHTNKQTSAWSLPFHILKANCLVSKTAEKKKLMATSTTPEPPNKSENPTSIYSQVITFTRFSEFILTLKSRSLGFELIQDFWLKHLWYQFENPTSIHSQDFEKT